LALRRRLAAWASSSLLTAVLFALRVSVAYGDDLGARAEAGDVAAQFQLATMYDLGEQGVQDARLAFRWYLSAAKAGLPAAEFNVAVMLDSGRGALRDAAEAAAWYGRAAARGNYRAQYNLALLYDAGDGVPHNAHLAAFWLRKAAPGVPVAMKRISALRPSEHTSTVVPAILQAPRSEIATGAAPLEFVWTAAMQAEPVHYLVEIRALSLSGSREVVAEFTDGSAILAPLRDSPGEYAWRVFTLTRVAAHYVVSDWTKFTVLP
jgi:Sel1 repeat